MGFPLSCDKRIGFFFLEGKVFSGSGFCDLFGFGSGNSSTLEFEVVVL